MFLLWLVLLDIGDLLILKLVLFLGFFNLVSGIEDIFFVFYFLLIIVFYFFVNIMVV